MAKEVNRDFWSDTRSTLPEICVPVSREVFPGPRPGPRYPESVLGSLRPFSGVNHRGHDVPTSSGGLSKRGVRRRGLRFSRVVPVSQSCGTIRGLPRPSRDWVESPEVHRDPVRSTSPRTEEFRVAGVVRVLLVPYDTVHSRGSPSRGHVPRD